MQLVAFPAACSSCDRQANAERFGCGWDDRYAGHGRIAHTWDLEQRTCPRWHLEAHPEVSRVLHDLEDYRRGAMGPVGQLPAPMVDYLRIADSAQRQWVEDSVG